MNETVIATIDCDKCEGNTLYDYAKSSSYKFLDPMRTQRIVT
jgi:hypothetical protein